MNTGIEKRVTRLEAGRQPATVEGGAVHTDPAHVAAVLQALYEAGALEEVLARSGLTLDDLDGGAAMSQYVITGHI